MHGSSTRSPGCTCRSGSLSASMARGCRTAPPRKSLPDALLVAALDVLANGHVADVLIRGAFVVRAQRLVRRDAVEAQIRLARGGRVAFRPPQQPTSETVVVPAHGESVQISGVIRVPGPEERIVPLHDEGADRLAVRLGQPGLAGFDR